MKVPDYDRIPPCVEPRRDDEPFAINVIVETPRGTHYKYAIESSTGVLTLRAVLPKGLHWPCDFGFVPQTTAGDGDPIDVALLFDEPVFPACLVRARLIGGFGLVKAGERNDRLIASPLPMRGVQQWTDAVHAIDDLPGAVFEGLRSFFASYPEEQGQRTEITGTLSPDDALHRLRDAHARWRRERAAERSGAETG